MASQDLLNYISEAKSKDMSDEEIQTQLIHAGWGMTDVKNAFETLGITLTLPLTPARPKDSVQPASKEIVGNNWDVFLHHLMYSSLFFLAISLNYVVNFLNLVYTSDPANFVSSELFMYGYFPLVFFGISFLVWAFLFLTTTKRVLAAPGVRRLKSRRILGLMSSVISVGFLILYVYVGIDEVINGRMLQTFGTGDMIGIAISMTIFVFLLWQLKEDKRMTINDMVKYYRFIGLLSIIYLALLILGFSIVGSPSKLKSKMHDTARSDKIMYLIGHIGGYAEMHKRLPASREEFLKNERQGVIGLFQDPVTRLPFEYSALSPTEYEICVDFDTESTDDSDTEFHVYSKGKVGNPYIHKKGHDCIHLAVKSEPSIETPTPTPNLDSVSLETPTPTPTFSPDTTAVGQ